MADQIMQALDEMQARCDAATPGPWEAEKGGESHCGDRWCSECWDNRIWADGLVLAESYRGGMSDVEFIAAARTDLPKALAALRAALEEADTIVEEFEHPAYRGNGYAEGLAASARRLRFTIADALGADDV